MTLYDRIMAYRKLKEVGPGYVVGVGGLLLCVVCVGLWR